MSSPSPTLPTPPRSSSEPAADASLQPYQVDYNTAAIRGPQVGYNICNGTTENQQSMCQTSFVNHLDGKFARLLSLGPGQAQFHHR